MAINRQETINVKEFNAGEPFKVEPVTKAEAAFNATVPANTDRLIPLSESDINIIINVLNVVGNGKYYDIICKLRGEK